MKNMTEVLKSIYLFKDLTDDELKKIGDLCTEINCTAGQDIFIQTQTAEKMYFIKMGSIQLSTQSKSGDDVSLAVLGSGSHFGEMPFLDRGTRTATASATESSFLIELPYAPLEKLLSENKDIAIKVYRSWGKFLAARLRSTITDNTLLKDLKLKF